MSVQIMMGDCLDRMKEIPDGSINLVLCDLPYGTTACKWDSVIPFEPLWAEYRRVIKPESPLVFTACQPFTSALVMSNMDWFRYSWVWNKSHPSNVFNAKKRPMQRHEDILVFCESGMPAYFPQMEACDRFKTRTGDKKQNRKNISEHYGDSATQEVEDGTERYPTTDLYYSSGARRKSVHPTQKPVDLMAYLIRTYTKKGDTVLDNTMGSGTTGVACVATWRNFIGIEKDPEYFEIARMRLNSPSEEPSAEREAKEGFLF